MYGGTIWKIISYLIYRGMWAIQKRRKVIPEGIKHVVDILKMEYADADMMGAIHKNVAAHHIAHIIPKN